MSQIQELYEKDIFRPINGVIKAEQKDNDSLRQELEEYVLTEELDKHFRSFYRYFNQSLDQRVDKHGVWISGFFGSGKSHFLKILGYLLANQPEVNGHKPMDFFDEKKIKDGLFRSEMGRPNKIPMDVMLFNIDSKASSSGGQKDTIVNVFWRVFDDMQGYFGEVPHIAEMEAHLDREGLFDSFKQSFARLRGESWESSRKAHAFLKKQIVQALQEVTGLDEDSAGGIMYDLKATINRSPEGFATRVKAYLDRKGKTHRVLFLVDEVGQYIGDSSDLMLNLQTIVEDFAIHCDGRAWVLVTSQEDIDSIIKHLTQAKKNDFSKIQGRFYAPLSLSSANTDEVIKKRLLQKTESASDALSAFYAREKVNLGNLIVFSQDTAFYPRFKDTEDFVDTYPFLPYQFTLLQQVFRSIREAGGSGKHMAEGERSMLESFKLTLETLAEQEIGSLVPFYYFYHSIEGFLEHSIRWVFQQAEKNEELVKPIDVNLLKILFMIRWVKELKPNQDNLLTLMIDHTNNDKAVLRKALQQALTRLEQQTLIQRTGDEYYFLTNEEQEIMRKIKAISIDPGEVNQKLQTVIFGKVYTGSKLRYDATHSYEFNKKLDGSNVGQLRFALTLEILTPCGETDYSEESYGSKTISGDVAIVRLPKAPNLYAEMQHLLQTEKYFQLHGSTGGSTITQRINDQFNREKTHREQELQNQLDRMITEADVFTGGEKVAKIDRKSAAGLIEESLRRLVVNVYPKLDEVTKHYTSEKEVDAALSEAVNQQPDLLGNPPNYQARQSMLNWFQDQQTRQAVVTVARLLEHFGQKPFGWAELDTLGVMAELIYIGKLELRVHQERQKIAAGLTKRLLSKQGSQEHVLLLQREISDADLRQAQALLRDQFNQVSPPYDAEALFKVFRGVLQEQSAQLQAFAQESQAAYPCHELLLETSRTLGSLLKPTHYLDFFDVLGKHQASLSNHQENYTDLESFYTGQKVVFDKGLEQIKELSPEISHVTDPVLRQNFEKAQAIMTSQDGSIYVKLPSVSMLLQPVIQGVEKLLKEEQNRVLQQIQAARTRFEQAYPSKKDDVSLLAPLEQLAAEVTQARSIDTVLARGSRISGVEKRIYEQAARVEPPKVEPSSGTTPQPIAPPPPPQIEVVLVKPAQALLKSQEDVEDYISQLAANFRRLIRENKHIQVQ